MTGSCPGYPRSFPLFLYYTQRPAPSSARSLLFGLTALHAACSTSTRIVDGEAARNLNRTLYGGFFGITIAIDFVYRASIVLRPLLFLAFIPREVEHAKRVPQNGPVFYCAFENSPVWTGVLWHMEPFFCEAFFSSWIRLLQRLEAGRRGSRAFAIVDRMDGFGVDRCTSEKQIHRYTLLLVPSFLVSMRTWFVARVIGGGFIERLDLNGLITSKREDPLTPTKRTFPKAQTPPIRAFHFSSPLPSRRNRLLRLVKV
jgi:hypothetical protein